MKGVTTVFGLAGCSEYARWRETNATLITDTITIFILFVQWWKLFELIEHSFISHQFNSNWFNSNKIDGNYDHQKKKKKIEKLQICPLPMRWRYTDTWLICINMWPKCEESFEVSFLSEIFETRIHADSNSRTDQIETRWHSCHNFSEIFILKSF